VAFAIAPVATSNANGTSESLRTYALAAFEMLCESCLFMANLRKAKWPSDTALRLHEMGAADTERKTMSTRSSQARDNRRNS
jgi:hypothetical protein